MKQVFYRHTINSPLGLLTLVVDRKGTTVNIAYGPQPSLPTALEAEENKYVCGQLAWELNEYFLGLRQEFSVDIMPQGSRFQLSIWNYLLKVPYGVTISYGELARRCGRKGAARTVASAVAANPIPIIIPCHRIIPARGGVGFYALHHLPAAEGTSIKSRLLSLEKSNQAL